MQHIYTGTVTSTFSSLHEFKWLISCSYNPHKAYIKKHLQDLGKNLDLRSSKYENFIIMGDFNAEPSEKAMSDFLLTCTWVFNHVIILIMGWPCPISRFKAALQN